MALQKCPRCELNYILESGESLCSVCREEVHGKVDVEDASALCSVCGEEIALPGKDMCKGCYADFVAMDNTAADTLDEDDAGVEASDIEQGDDLETLELLEDEDAFEEQDLSAEVADEDAEELESEAEFERVKR